MNATQQHRHADNRILLKLLSAAIASLISGQSLAEPGTLANSPLFLSTSVQSNIFMTVDDSGSMDWEILKSAGADAIYTGNSFPNSGNVDITPTRTDRDEMLESCAGYNTLYFDPTKTYTPWVGVDINNVAYVDQIITSARNNPYDPAAGTTDLTQSDGADFPGYMTWTDDGDGVFEQGECPDPGLAGYNHATQYTPTSAMSATQQTNFANWFSYYRKREYVAKRALSEIVSKSTARIGLATLWNNNNVRTPVRDVDDITAPLNATARTNKNTLLRNLFRINSNNGTPLRRALQNTGIYFESGLPAWGTEWASSPILPESQGGACQQNFTVLMSDGYWNSDTGGEIVANNADGDDNSAWDGDSYADGISDTLADVAMYYYERDLSASLPNEVRRTAADQNDAQHLVTFTVAFGVNGTLSANPTYPLAAFAWPNPIDTEDEERVDDMRHAAWNGRGLFLNAGNPDNLISTLGDAIADIDARSGSAAAVSFNSTSLQSNTMIFQAVFDSARWTGDLNAIPISTSGTIGSISWTAANGATADSSGLDERDYTLRNIFTYNGTAGVDFSWANLTTAQKNDLKTDPNGTLANDATGKARLGLIRGDRSCEQSSTATCSYTEGASTYTAKGFRNRGSLLGDIVHSSPLFVGAPNTPYPDSIETAPYSTFVNSGAKNRREAVYVGSNDGMLHAFDAENNGQELFAYVPSLLFSATSGLGLQYLTDPNYAHKWYVDLSATAADVYLSGWKTLLVGALRGGGKGVFALDVTDPTAFNASKVLWEFTHADLGYTFSDIRIGKLNNGKWAAIFGNGYNNDPLGDGKAKLFIVYLDGTNLASPIIINTGAGSMTSSSCGNAGSDCNGLSSPALADLNGDGTIDRVYAGDLHGNLWAFSLSGNNTTNWNVAFSGSPLARACTSATCTIGNRQPITSRPSLARHKTQRDAGTAPNIMVFFGTGQYIATNDNDDSLQQTFYGIWDSGTGDVTRSSLQEQTLSTDTSNGKTVRTLSENTVSYSTKRGWFIDLLTSKERIVTSSVAIGDLVFFNSMIPSTNICGYGGSGWLMLATQLDGGAPTFGAVDVDGDGVIDDNDLTALNKFVAGIQTDGIPTESRFISDKRVTTDSSGGINADTVEAFARNAPARTSWSPLEF